MRSSAQYYIGFLSKTHKNDPDITQSAIIERIVPRNTDAKNIVILRWSGQSPAHEKLNSSQKGPGELVWSKCKGV